MSEKSLAECLESLPPAPAVIKKLLKQFPRGEECAAYEATARLVPGAEADRAHLVDLSA